MIGFGQQTYVPDDNFEAYLEANGMGNGIANDDYVNTASIDTVIYLDVTWQFISDLTGIENFIALTELDCSENDLTTLDLSQNTFLTYLNCARNWGITGLDVSTNSAIEYLDCHDNLINSLDVSNKLSLVYLYCQDNKITSLDLSQNSNLIELSCGDNQLTSLNIRNGNNNNLTYFSCDDNFSLNCINVDDVAWATTNLTDIDPQHYFSTNCPTTLIQEHTANKELLKVTDLLGRETKQTNQPLFYIYDDGIVEKKIVIE